MLKKPNDVSTVMPVKRSPGISKQAMELADTKDLHLAKISGDDLVEFMRNSPLDGAEDIHFERDRSVTR